MSQPLHLSAIVAMSENRVIGDNNQLPWHLPADLKHFKTITQGHPILMGRKTHESIGIPLPQRTNIILTRNPGYSAPGCVVVTSLDEVMKSVPADCDEIFVIGGAEIYQQLLPKVDRIYLTIVHEIFEGDTYFPKIDANEWQEIENTRYKADEKNEYDYSFLTLTRK